MSVVESLVLCEGRLGIRNDIPLKAAKFGIKISELSESSTGYMWYFVVIVLLVLKSHQVLSGHSNSHVLKSW
jgi:hypothetical protein